MSASLCVQVEREQVEAMLPKGATELTKQQIRYLLQVRVLCICVVAVKRCPVTDVNDCSLLPR